MTGPAEIRSNRPVWGSIPRALLRDPHITPTAKAVFALLDDYASPSAPAPFPSHRVLAEHLGMEERSMRRPLLELAEAGWVEKVPRPGTSNLYVLHWYPARERAGGRASERGVPRASERAEGEPMEGEPLKTPQPPASGGPQRHRRREQPEPVNTSSRLPDFTGLEPVDIAPPPPDLRNQLTRQDANR